MSKRWWMVAGALLLCCAAAPAALAVGEPQVTLKLGSSLPTGDYGSIASGGIMAGLDVGYKVSKRFGMGVDLDYYRNTGFRDGKDFEIYDPSLNEYIAITLAESWSVAQVGAWGKGYFLQGHRLTPYARAGGGVYNVTYTYDIRISEKGTRAGGNESAGKFGMNGGLGVSFAITKNTALGVEGLYHQVMMRGNDVSYWTVGATLGFGAGGK